MVGSAITGATATSVFLSISEWIEGEKIGREDRQRNRDRKREKSEIERDSEGLRDSEKLRDTEIQ